MQQQIPQNLINFTVYRDGSTFLGTADITLPSIEYLTDTIKGAGIAGEVEIPTIGNFGSMTVTLNWRTIAPEAIKLLAPVSHALDFRAVQQVFDVAGGTIGSQGFKVSIRAMPKKGDLGKLDVGAKTDSVTELEVSYIKVEIDGRNMLEIDKFNYKCVIDGVDYLADLRAKLGMG